MTEHAAERAQARRPYFVTTPIFYVNDRPHIGHAYSATVSDTLCRYAGLRGRQTRLLTGTDEHGQKIESRARDEGLTPGAFVDRMAPRFRAMAATMHTDFNDFIRTTSERHRSQAQALWRTLEARGDLYLGEYEGWYSVSEETFLTEKELLEGNLCPYSKQPAVRVKEASYFFRLSRYTQPLLDWYAAHPDFVTPAGRYEEVKRFVAGGLNDLSVSRTSFRWGVPVPGAPGHVMYVWLDALANYLSALDALKEGGPSPLAQRFWGPTGEVTHVVGKDILRFHAIFWPAFLLSAGLEPPTRILAHGWLTADGEKMSKSRGNFVPAEPLAERYGADALRYYLMRDVALGQDGDFSHQRLDDRYHNELGNGLGNLSQRVLASLVAKRLEGKTPALHPDADTGDEASLRETARRCAEACGSAFERHAPHSALDAVFELIGAANRYVDTVAPWTLKNAADKPRLEHVCYHVMEVLRWVSVLLHPVLPERTQALRAQLGLGPLRATAMLDLWPHHFGALQPGTPLGAISPLFPRFDKQVPVNTAPQDKPAPAKAEPATNNGHLDIALLDDVELRVAEVRVAEPVPKSKRLLRLEVDLGEPEPRQILAGIQEHFSPESLVGKQVLVVANLKPRKLMGLSSQGMVLALKDEAGLTLLSPSRPVTPGTRAS